MQRCWSASRTLPNKQGKVFPVGLLGGRTGRVCRRQGAQGSKAVVALGAGAGAGGPGLPHAASNLPYPISCVLRTFPVSPESTGLPHCLFWQPGDSSWPRVDVRFESLSRFQGPCTHACLRAPLSGLLTRHAHAHAHARAEAHLHACRPIRLHAARRLCFQEKGFFTCAPLAPLPQPVVRVLVLASDTAAFRPPGLASLPSAFDCLTAGSTQARRHFPWSSPTKRRGISS